MGIVGAAAAGGRRRGLGCGDELVVEEEMDAGEGEGEGKAVSGWGGGTVMVGG